MYLCASCIEQSWSHHTLAPVIVDQCRSFGSEATHYDVYLASQTPAEPQCVTGARVHSVVCSNPLVGLP